MRHLQTMPIARDVFSQSKRPMVDSQVLLQLASADGSLFYEFQMLTAAVDAWRMLSAKQERTPLEDFCKNAAIECFLVHFRNLRDFFYPSPDVWNKAKWFDNAVAWDYDPTWDKATADWQGIGLQERERANKLLAHISYSRPDLDHDWTLMPAMRNALVKEVRELVGRVPDERREWFKAILNWVGCA
jgi:hypothetical protein